MAILHRRRGQNWFTFFPVEERLRAESPSDPLLVDVSGSQGGDIISFQTAYPKLRGRLILQDLPIVIEGAKNIPPGIEAQGYDSFQE